MGEVGFPTTAVLPGFASTTPQLPERQHPYLNRRDQTTQRTSSPRVPCGLSTKGLNVVYGSVRCVLLVLGLSLPVCLCACPITRHSPFRFSLIVIAICLSCLSSRLVHTHSYNHPTTTQGTRLRRPANGAHPEKSGRPLHRHERDGNGRARRHPPRDREHSR